MSHKNIKRGDYAIAASCYAYAAAHQARFGNETMLDIEPPSEWPLDSKEWQVGATAEETINKAKLLLSKEMLAISEHPELAKIAAGE